MRWQDELKAWLKNEHPGCTVAVGDPWPPGTIFYFSTVENPFVWECPPGIVVIDEYAGVEPDHIVDLQKKQE